ncbi:MAG: hypothetical protein IT218_02625 [Ignavibacteria bacterium]|nr:hypothetical protein [Ignavibacteria bacterium]
MTQRPIILWGTLLSLLVVAVSAGILLSASREPEHLMVIGRQDLTFTIDRANRALDDQLAITMRVRSSSRSVSPMTRGISTYEQYRDRVVASTLDLNSGWCAFGTDGSATEGFWRCEDTQPMDGCLVFHITFPGLATADAEQVVWRDKLFDSGVHSISIH